MNASDVLRFICANQGAVNTGELLANLGAGDPVGMAEMICDQEKFASCCPFGQPKVVARTGLRLCRARGCPGSCAGLHLCKSFLLGGTCQFGQMSRGCCFSHELDSDHNQQMLREHGLESLSREELRTLMLQSDDRMLPQICYDYNNGHGEFGQCQMANDCKRLHVCERYLNRSCTCTRTHDLNAPQPLKVLQNFNVPDNLISSLKSVYANLQALKYSQSRGSRANKEGSQQPGCFRGHRGNWSNRGKRGNQGTRPRQQFACSTGDIHGLYSESGPNKGNDTDTSSDDGKNRQTKNPNKALPFAGGRGSCHGNGGKQQRFSRTGSIGDIAVATCALDQVDADGPADTGPNEDNNDRQEPKSSNITVAATNSDASSDHDQSENKTQNPRSTAVRGRGGPLGSRGDHQRLTTNDTSAAVGEDGHGDATPNRRERQRPARDKTEICMFFIKGHCIHEERCFKAHDKMPYRWEVREDDQWAAMPENETIEKDYCDPKNTNSTTSPPVCFDTMTCGPNNLKVRRLSTINSLLEPSYIHTTEWVWYWEDEFGKWNIYASTDGGHNQANLDSAALEQKFLDNAKDVVEFSANSQSYSLNFQDMIQTNKQYGTKKLVRRRPRFVSMADVQARRVRKPLVQMNFAAVPAHWDKTQVPQTGFKRITLQHSSEEFKEMESLFCATMKGFDLVSIERIQNKALWEVFQWQKTQMKIKNGGHNVKEKKLFHGTDNKFVDAICQNNMDWRLCGTHGTAYGKGSYFARDARYSHSYTSDSSVKSMFIARVLVGDYTKGSPTYPKAPSKDGGDVNFFDSCVDDAANPSIYVLFEKHQIYPEYLLQYRTTDPLAVSARIFNPAAPLKPAPAPRSAAPINISVYKSTTSFYQPSSSSNQPSSSSYQPSSSSYQPSSSSNQPSSSYQPSSSFYQPSSSSYQPSSSSNQPSSSSYQYRPSAYTSSSSRTTLSSPVTKEKPSNSSCIIG